VVMAFRSFSMIDPLRNRAGRRARHPQDWPA
jgi:hypothetical protein